MISFFSRLEENENNSKCIEFQQKSNKISNRKYDDLYSLNNGQNEICKYLDIFNKMNGDNNYKEEEFMKDCNSNESEIFSQSTIKSIENQSEEEEDLTIQNSFHTRNSESNISQVPCDASNFENEYGPLILKAFKNDPFMCSSQIVQTLKCVISDFKALKEFPIKEENVAKVLDQMNTIPRDYLIGLINDIKLISFNINDIKTEKNKMFAQSRLNLSLDSSRHIIIMELVDTLICFTREISIPSSEILTIDLKDKRFFVKIRPYALHFLRSMNRHGFEIILYTILQKDIAFTICNYLDPEKQYIKYCLCQDETNKLVLKKEETLFFLKNIKYIKYLKDNHQSKIFFISSSILYFCYYLKRLVLIEKFTDNNEKDDVLLRLGQYLRNNLLKNSSNLCFSQNGILREIFDLIFILCQNKMIKSR